MSRMASQQPMYPGTEVRRIIARMRSIVAGALAWKAAGNQRFTVGSTEIAFSRELQE